MKKIIPLLIFLCTVITINSPIYAQGQYYWHQPQRISSGYIDKNPSFGRYNIPGVTGFNIFNWEFFVFERTTATTTHICAQKMGTTGPLESVVYLTSNASSKRNPVISYGKANYAMYGDLNSALVLWESNQNGKWDIYGKYYSRQSGWGNVFPLDSSAGDKSLPHTCFIDSTTYAASYIKNGDVIFRKFNPLTRVVLYDSNLTVSDTAFCSNPNVMASDPSKIIVTYEKKKTDGKKAIWYRKTNSTSTPVWSTPDTIAFAGDNTFDQFCFPPNAYSSFGVAFESNRGGTYILYVTTIPYASGTTSQERIFQYAPPAYNYSNFVDLYYPIITDYVPMQSCAFQRKGRDSLKIIFDENVMYPYVKDSTTIGDTSKRTSITMNSGIFNSNWYITVWVVYSKDSANTSQLWARYRLTTLGDIKKINSIAPSEFSLSQNFPNPFNPVTAIQFSIPEKGNLNTGNGIISLKVFDLLGRETAVLVNQHLKPGTYEVKFDASELTSGIYYYQLSVNNNSLAVRKMAVVK